MLAIADTVEVVNTSIARLVDVGAQARFFVFLNQGLEAVLRFAVRHGRRQKEGGECRKERGKDLTFALILYSMLLQHRQNSY